MKMNRKSGISLIVLVITIIVIIILAGAVILSLSANNPISQASKATYLSDVKNFETELELYKGKQFVDNTGVYDPTLLQADNDSVTYNGVLDTSITMKNLIPSLGAASKYNGQFQVIAGKLIYGGLDINKQAWTLEAGLEVVIIGEPKITILSPSPILAERGTNIIYTVKFSSNLALTTINLAGKVEVLDDAGVTLPVQPVISIGTISGTATDTARQVDITITTSNLANGSYKLKIKPGAVTNSNSISNTIDTISLIKFDILDSIPPVNPTMVASPTVWTNGNVSVTINYSTDSVTKEYSTNGTTWNAYTAPIVVSTNATTVYARGKDIAINESGVASLTVANIDKTVPVITLNGNSNINVGTGVAYTEYGVVATDNTDTTIQGKVTISGVVNTSVSGTYVVRYNVTDAAGNVAIQITRTVNVITSVNVFAYTGNVQNLNVPYPGNYKIEVWAAQGGNNLNIIGGLGAYSKGTINLALGKTLYIYVGGQDGYNGGGAAGTGSACENGAKGGGATDVRNDGTALTNRFIVAGGGGGASGAGSGHYQGYTGYNGAFGGGGNGNIAGAPSLYHGAGGLGGGTGAGNGGSSRGGDTNSMPTFAKGYNGENGTLGQGGAGGGVYGDRLDYYGPGSGSGGGGGYYGGGRRWRICRMVGSCWRCRRWWI